MAEVIQIELYPHQSEFMFAKEKIVALIGGLGSGKTWSGVQWVIHKLHTNSETVGLIATNTFGQLMDSTLDAVFEEFNRLKIKYSYNEKSGWLTVISFNNAQIKCASLDNYNSLRGIEVGWVWLDETRDTKEAAFNVVLGRLRHKKSKKLELRITTTPSGFNWLYDRLVGEKSTRDCKVIYASTYMNKSLPPDYIELLESQYDDKMIRQELNAEFISLTSGKVYHSFDRKRHVRHLERTGSSRLKAGMDFNIENMTSCVGEIHDNFKIHITEEFVDIYDTFSMAEEMFKKLGSEIDIVPDSTGKARKSSSKSSDHQILRNKGFTLIQSRNPFIEDRWNTVNKLLKEDRIIIDPKCKRLIKELEQADLKKASQQEGEHYHVSVALGYLAYRYFALKPIRKSANVSVREL